MSGITRLLAKELSSALGITDNPNAFKSSIPKSSMNPLVKSRSDLSETEGDFYSPVLSTIEQMTIGKKGSKGENISAFLHKRAPNVAKSELDSFELDLDPQRLYTREELVKLAKEKGSTKYSIEKVDDYSDEIEKAQRQFVQDEEVDFVILTLQGEKDYLRLENDAHFGGTKNLGHTRSSIRRETPIEGKEINDGDSYLLMEEIQSDTAKKRSDNNDAYSIVRVTDVDTEEDIRRHVFETFNDLDTDFGLDFDVDIDKDVLNTIQKFYRDVYINPELKTLGDVNIQKKLLKNKDALKEILKKEHGITAVGLDIDKISHSAIRDTLQGEGDIESPYLSDEIEDAISFLNSKIADHYSEKFKVPDIKKSPILSRSDYLKKLILSNIAYAKRNNLTKIVIPNYKEIARQRTDTFDEVVDSSSPYYAKYEEAMKTGEHDKVAQEYFEGVFKKTYKDALDKVLNTLKKESNNTIKIGTRELRYGDLTQKKRYRTSNATEIDISEFDYNPEKQQLRFSEGGLVQRRTK